MQSSQFDYKKYLKLILHHKELFVVVALLIMTAAFATSYLLPRQYESSSTVFIEKSVISELVKGFTAIPSLEDNISVLTYAITSRSLLSRVVNIMHLDQGKKTSQREALIRSLQRNTRVKVKDRNLFIISFADRDPRIARDFVNTLVRTYIEENLSSLRGETSEATNFLGDQIKTFKAKLDKAEEDLNAYKREKGAVLTMDEGRLFQEIAVARDKLADLELKRRQLEGMRQVTRKADDPLQIRLNTLQKQLEELLVQYTESYPEVVQVRGEIQSIKERMKGRRNRIISSLDSQELGKIDSEVAAIRISEDGLRRSIATNSALLQQVPNAKAGLEKLETERQNQKKIYDQIFARHTQSEVSQQMEVQDKSTTFRVVDPAVLPAKPSSPNRLKIMLLGIFAGIAGGFGLIFMLEQLDGSVKDVEFVKGLGAPVLAIIPRMEDSVQRNRQRRRSGLFLLAAVSYFLVMMTLPVMEYLGLPYMDRLLENVRQEESLQSAIVLSR